MGLPPHPRHFAQQNEKADARRDEYSRAAQNGLLSVIG